MTRITTNNKQKIALVLSGGGALGASHIGATKILEEKYLPEYFYGTSAGAIICAAPFLIASERGLKNYFNVVKVRLKPMPRGYLKKAWGPFASLTKWSVISFYNL